MRTELAHVTQRRDALLAAEQECRRARASLEAENASLQGQNAWLQGELEQCQGKLEQCQQAIAQLEGLVKHLRGQRGSSAGSTEAAEAPAPNAPQQAADGAGEELGASASAGAHALPAAVVPPPVLPSTAAEEELGAAMQGKPGPGRVRVTSCSLFHVQHVTNGRVMARRLQRPDLLAWHPLLQRPTSPTHRPRALAPRMSARRWTTPPWTRACGCWACL